jgi:hypothetical protein
MPNVSTGHLGTQGNFKKPVFEADGEDEISRF